jgi:hypothetical protein
MIPCQIQEEALKLKVCQLSASAGLCFARFKRGNNGNNNNNNNNNTGSAHKQQGDSS